MRDELAENMGNAIQSGFFTPENFIILYGLITAIFILGIYLLLYRKRSFAKPPEEEMYVGDILKRIRELEEQIRLKEKGKPVTSDKTGSGDPEPEKPSAASIFPEFNFDEKSDAFTILGIRNNNGLSKETVLSAYKKRIKMYHPDKYSHLGEEYMELAKVKTVLINRAKDRLIKRIEKQGKDTREGKDKR